jgi:hypothetical protein
MKQIKHLMIICLVVFQASTLVAQQGNVAAGGDAAGTGGSMSYSVGQTDYLIYSSPQGSLSLGLQQIYDAGDPSVLEVPSTVISNGELLCFSAETVIIAGSGKHFIVEAYGHADIIAGYNILLKPGTKVELLGSLHARISEDWCPPPESLLASFFEPISDNPIFDPKPGSSFFNVYPNPTTGLFTLELNEFDEASAIVIEISSMVGERIIRQKFPAAAQYQVDLSRYQPGIYLVRVIQGNEAGVLKVMKQ